MASLDAQLGSAILAKAQAGLGEITSALSRTFDHANITIEFGTPENFAAEKIADSFAGPGLGILLNVGAQHVAIILTETGGFLPDWYASPDPTGQSKLTTLAQELGMLLLPDEFMPEDFRAERIGDLKVGLTAATPTEAAGQFSFTINAGEKKTTALLIWPLSTGKELFGTASTAVTTETAQPSTPSPTPAITAAANQATPKNIMESATPAALAPRILSFNQLPSFTRSILKVKLPVRVALAHKRQSIDQIVELGPGSIIQFDKSCEEMLDLVVGDQLIAQGEAVKVGEKFGLRITSMVLPSERFEAVRTTG